MRTFYYCSSDVLDNLFALFLLLCTLKYQFENFAKIFLFSIFISGFNSFSALKFIFDFAFQSLRMEFFERNLIFSFLTDYGCCWRSLYAKEDAWLLLHGWRALCSIIRSLYAKEDAWLLLYGWRALCSIIRTILLQGKKLRATFYHFMYYFCITFSWSTVLIPVTISFIFWDLPILDNMCE